ncbi:MAG: hypothetical protein EOO23_03640 [Comamonadaceae bacterium]|nr:MAG: hypothetical protein EOO23_03640 [Comamonadaceae bacterium]
MTPRQARAARAMLGLSMKEVCTMAGVGKRTLTEFEGGNRAVYPATENKIKSFYLSQGLSFSPPEDGEAIRFAIAEENSSLAAAEVRDKTEILDILQSTEVLELISNSLEIHKIIDQRPNISRAVIIETLKRSGFNQKDLSVQIGCTPSFINSITSGKKSLPIKYASFIQKYFDKSEFDVEKALQNEKRSEKLLAEIIALQQKYVAIWRSIN